MSEAPIALPFTASSLARLDALLNRVGAALGAEALAAAVGQLLPGIKCRFCDASDVLEEPYRSTGRVHLHLLDLQGHCIRVTSEWREATGLLLASVADGGHAA